VIWWFLLLLDGLATVPTFYFVILWQLLLLVGSGDPTYKSFCDFVSLWLILFLLCGLPLRGFA
jgi:hypothetical protein